MKKTDKLKVTEDQCKILEILDEKKRLTTSAIHSQLFPTLNLRSVQIKLQALANKKMVMPHLLHEEEGNRSERLYTLLLAGAKAIGKDSLKTAHRRKQKRVFFEYDQAQANLAHLANIRGWSLLYGNDAVMALKDHLKVIPTVLKISPDSVLITDEGIYIVVFAHPYSEHMFWHKRIKRYKGVINSVEIIAICSETLAPYANHVLGSSPYSGQFKLLTYDQLAKFLTTNETKNISFGVYPARETVRVHQIRKSG